MVHDIRDITIIGGGPTGLFALFYAGMRQVTAQIVDALKNLTSPSDCKINDFLKTARGALGRIVLVFSQRRPMAG